MSCSVIIKNVFGNERRVDVDSEEELKNMTVTEFKRRFCPDDERRGYKLFILKELEDRQSRPLPNKEPEDDQTRGDCDRKHESVHELEPGCSGDISNRSTGQGSESVDFPHDRPGSVTKRSVSPPIPWLRPTVTEYLNYDQTLGHYGIREGSTIHEMEFSYGGSVSFRSACQSRRLLTDLYSGPLCLRKRRHSEDEDEGAKRRPPPPEDEDKIIPRSRSMENLLFDM